MIVAAVLLGCDNSAVTSPLSVVSQRRGPRTLSISPSVVALQPSGTALLTTVLADSIGVTAPATGADWSSDAPDVASVVDGRLVAGRPGIANIEAALGGMRSSATVRVCAPGERGVVGAEPAVVVPDEEFTLVGCDLPATLEGTTLSVDGNPARVTAAEGGTVVRGLLPRGNLRCGATRNVRIALHGENFYDIRRQPFATAKQFSMQVGEAVSLAGPRVPTCIEFANVGGKYLIGITNLGPKVGSWVPLIFGGAVGLELVPEIVPTPVPPQQVVDVRAAATALEGSEAVSHPPQHPSKLATDHNTNFALPAARVAAVSASAETVGELHQMRVWRPSSGSCAGYTDVQARTVYTGSRVVVREDVSNVTAGVMDDMLIALGQEFDNSVFPLISANFGNPLALDTRLDNNGRVILLFSRAVNQLGGYTAFVIACDFRSRSRAASSNEGETVYLHVPTTLERGFPQSGALTRERWYRRIRSAVVHETKHLAAYAERLSRNLPLEEFWLEEGTAMIAEELWARSVQGIERHSDADYASSIRCAIHTEEPACISQPFALWEHFRFFNTFERLSEILSPVSRFTENDDSVYGSAWAFLRWILDHHTESESGFLRSVTTAPVTGVRNVERTLGRDARPLIADWMMALALEYYPGFTPARSDLTFPSWNTPDIFAGMHDDRPGIFLDRAPLAIRKQPFGTFATLVELRANSTTLFELSGEQSRTQVLGLSVSLSRKPFTYAAINIVRVE